MRSWMAAGKLARGRLITVPVVSSVVCALFAPRLRAVLARALLALMLAVMPQLSAAPAAFAAYSVGVNSPTPPLAASTFVWTFSGVKPGPGQEISNVVLSGCWNASQVSSVKASSGSAGVEKTGTIKVESISDTSLPLTITVTFAATWQSRSSITTLTYKAGTTSTTLMVSGPNCQLPAPPAAPANVAATQGNDFVTVAWAAPLNNGSPITGYTVKVYLSDGTTPVNGATGLTTAGTVTTTSVAGLTYGTAYTFAVTATNAIGTGPASSPPVPAGGVVFAKVPDPPPGITASSGPGNQQITLSWTAAKTYGVAVTGYTVACNPTCTGATGVTTNGSTTSVAVGNLSVSQAYTFTVTANSAVGPSTASAASSPAVRPATPPGAPTIGTATAGAEQATVTWSPPTSTGNLSITGYTIDAYTATTGATGTPVATASVSPSTACTSTTTCTGTVTGLTDGTAYVLTVRATNSAGTGPASAASSSVTPAAAVPGAPTNVIAAAGDAQAKVTWTAPPTPASGSIQQYTIIAAPGGLNITVFASSACTGGAGGTTTCSARVTGLNNGTSYTFTVVAINAAGAGPTSLVSNPVTPAALVATLPPTGPPPVPVPPAPSTIAPALDNTVATNVQSATSFLYSGSNPIQIGMAAGTIQLQRAAAIRGRVLTRGGQGLPGATVTVVGHQEFGETATQSDGSFDLAANGGGQLTVNVALNGYLPAQRQVQVPWQDYVRVGPIVLVPLDTSVTAVDLTSSAPIQVARGSVSTDADGTRQATLLVSQETTATMTLPNGTTQPLTSLHIRATEYTVGPNGPQAMPADLPATSLYTYAFDLSADEALTAGASHLTFSQVLPFYVENFLQFPVGGVVPVGYYDRTAGHWIASTNGVVVKVLSVANGIAVLDVDGHGSPASATELSSLGVTPTELVEVGSLYTAGQSLWRVPLTHFSTFDPNWPGGPPSDAQSPNQNPPCQGSDCPPVRDCQRQGSLIGCESQSLGEQLPIAGTNFTLHYQSNRQVGDRAPYTLHIPVSGATVPPSLKSIKLDIAVAGEHTTVNLAPSANQNYEFIWDGKDGYGRTIQGRQNVTVQITYAYPPVYMTPSQEFGAFAKYPSTGPTAVSIGCCHQGAEVTLSQTWHGILGRLDGTIGGWDDRTQGLGGWNLDVHHAYDPGGESLYLGNGENRSAQALLSAVATTVAGTGTRGYGGDGSPATQATLSFPIGIAVGPDGSLFIAQSGPGPVRRVSPDGIIRTYAGNGTTGGDDPDGRPATEAPFNNLTAVALGPDGSLFIADSVQGLIWRVAPDGIIHKFAGNGTGCVDPSLGCGDGGPATQASLGFVGQSGIAVGVDGSVYIVSTNRIRRVSPDGVINTVAGTGEFVCDASGDGGPASQARLCQPSGLAVGPDGSLFIADVGMQRIRRVDPRGVITRVAGSGNGSCGFGGDGGPATQSNLCRPEGITVATDGTLFIADLGNQRIRRVGTDGVITSIAGTGTQGSGGDGGLATQALLNSPLGVAVGPDGNVFIADENNQRIRQVKPAFPAVSSSDLFLPAENGSEVYVFDSSGRHLRTLNALTGATLYQFAYDSAGHLNTITDGNGNVTTIQHDTNGNPTAIVAPFGQQTNFRVDSNGYVASITDPANNAVQLSSTATGLLNSLTDARGGVHSFLYDSAARLTKDTEPDGSAKTLARTNTTNGYSVALTTQLGHTTTYAATRLSTGAVQRTITAADGAQTLVVIGTDGSTTATAPDGTVTTTIQGPDSRFGMLDPISSTQMVKTPRGLTSTTTMSRTALSDPTNQFSLTQQTDTTVINGRTATRVYSGSTRTFTDTTPAGRTRTMTIDSLGRVVSQQIGDLLPMTYTYDSNGRLSAITQGTGAIARTATFAYNPQGFLATTTDPLGRQTQLSYDTAGRITQQVLPGNRTVTYTYDGDSNVTAVTPPGRPTHSFSYTSVDLQSAYTPPDVGAGTNQTLDSYNSDHQFTQVSLPTGQSINFGYDTSGRLNSIGILHGTTSFGYDSAGRMSSITGPGGLGLSYGYDGSLVTSEAWAGLVAGSVARTYDANFRTTGMSVDGANTVSFAYDPDGFLSAAGSEALTYTSQSGLLNTTTMGGVSDQWTYNGFGEPTSYTVTANGTAADSVQYVRDQLGRITSKSETIAGVVSTTSYAYDTSARLSTVTTAAGTTTYTYDANGNRLSAVSPAGTVNGAYDAQDRLLTYGTNTYTYTADGQLRTKTNTTTGQTSAYQYDEFGNLLGVTLPDGTQIGYLIDGQNRRVGKTVGGVTVQRVLYDGGLRPIAQLDGNNNIVSRFVYGNRRNVPDFAINGGVTYRIITDQLGSPRLVIAVSTGAVVQRMDYDEFGNVVGDTNPGFQPFGFAGGLYDRDTGLLRFGARDYDPVPGRWVAKDPMRFKLGDGNLYVYAAQDPIDFADPSGLSVWCQYASVAGFDVAVTDSTVNATSVDPSQSYLTWPGLKDMLGFEWPNASNPQIQCVNSNWGSVPFPACRSGEEEADGEYWNTSPPVVPPNR
jgi:RHS repeat-associated protein